MKILLTNDDGVYAPGLAALESVLRELGDVTVVAPLTEQSGVGHSVTFLHPLVCREVFDGDRKRGWAVEGSPADCVKLALFELCKAPDLIVSGINGGLNAGINVLYSGTVAAAIEGAFFEITSIAVSLEYAEHADFDSAARIAVQTIRDILRHKGPSGELFNINIPSAALAAESPRVKVVPMGVERYGEDYDKRFDPSGRAYYWATNDPPPRKTDHETDLSALADGFVTLTPLCFDMTKAKLLSEMRQWDWNDS